MPGAGGSATFIAFGTIVKRSLTTFTPTRHSPRPLLSLPPHNTLVSKAGQSRKLPKNHFTSHRPLLNDGQHPPPPPQDQHGSKTQEKPPRRKAAQRTQKASSLRRVAVEAERSRGAAAGASGFIIGRGQRRHVDPEVETKDVTAYCAAETYNIHVARDLLRKEGWEADPCSTALFPQVLHVQVRNTTWGRAKEEEEGLGDVLVFPSGTVVAWNVPDKIAHHLVERVLPPAATVSHLDRLEAEDLEYIQDPTREKSQILGDTIILGTKSPHTSPSDILAADGAADHPHPETDTILAKIAFSSALARSTKLAVLESNLSSYFRTTSTLPSLLSRTRIPRRERTSMLAKTYDLLHIRAQLNLYSELTDSLPDLFWDSPHELGLESYFDAVSRALDVGQRIKALNEKMDYASEIASVLRERLSAAHSHFLEWIIIWLIVVEVLYGSWHLWVEYDENRDPESVKNLLKEYLKRELAKEGKEAREG